MRAAIMSAASMERSARRRTRNGDAGALSLNQLVEQGRVFGSQPNTAM